MNLTFRTISAVSLAAFIMLSSISPVVAGGHKNEAHQNAPGQIKKATQQLTHNLMPELPSQAILKYRRKCRTPTSSRRKRWAH